MHHESHGSDRLRGGRAARWAVALRRRLTFSNVTAAVALFVALGGSAYAVSANSVGTQQLKKNAVTPPKIKANAVTAQKLRANSVAAGKVRAGAINEAKLGDGAVTMPKLGSDVVGALGGAQDSLISGRITDLPPIADAIDNRWGAATGISAASATAAGVETLAPNVDGVATRLTMRLTDNATPDTGNRSIRLFVNGVQTNLVCSNVSAGTSCSSNQVVDVPAGSRLSMRASGICAPPLTCTINGGDMLFGWVWRPAVD